MFINKCLKISLIYGGIAVLLTTFAVIFFFRKYKYWWIYLILSIGIISGCCTLICNLAFPKCNPCFCPDICKSCPDCSACILQPPILCAYYTFYQDPNCSGDCDPHPCTASILSDPEVLNSKLDFVVINPIAPATAGGVTLSYINNIYTGQESQSNTYYPPPDPIKKGIDDLHANGKRVILSFLPGSANDEWGAGDTWFANFGQACQKIMTDWDIDGYDWDCETNACPPGSCGGNWKNQSCIDWTLTLLKTLKSLKPNPGRGVGGVPMVTWTGELTWQLSDLGDMSPFVDYIDFFMTMNQNYSIVNPDTLYSNMKNFSGQKGFPMNRIINGVKSGGCFPGTNGDGTDLAHFQTLLTKKVDGDKTITDLAGGWIIWNLSRDFGCKYGRSSDPAVSPDYGASATCKACNPGACPVGVGVSTAGDNYSFLKLAESIKK